MVSLALTNFIGLCLLATMCQADCEGWNYHRSDAEHGPDAWSTGDCATGKEGSPINIVTNSTVPVSKKAWNMVNFDKPYTYTAENHGYMVSFDESSEAMTVSGGGLPGTYRFFQIHFHWGSTNNAGSEHSVNGKFYPFEIHLAFYDDRYGNALDAILSGDKTATSVFVLFGEIDEKRNQNFAAVINGIIGIRKDVGMKKQVTLPPLISMFPQFLTSNYYRYQGGFTVPGCNEMTSWTVFEQPVSFTYYQLIWLRLVNSGSCGTEMYRPVQPLNGRKVLFFN